MRSLLSILESTDDDDWDPSTPLTPDFYEMGERNLRFSACRDYMTAWRPVGAHDCVPFVWRIGEYPAVHAKQLAGPPRRLFDVIRSSQTRAGRWGATMGFIKDLQEMGVIEVEYFDTKTRSYSYYPIDALHDGVCWITACD